MWSLLKIYILFFFSKKKQEHLCPSFSPLCIIKNTAYHVIVLALQNFRLEMSCLQDRDMFCHQSVRSKYKLLQDKCHSRVTFSAAFLVNMVNVLVMEAI